MQYFKKKHSDEKLKFMFSKKAKKLTKSSPLIWNLLSKRQIDREYFVIFAAFLENMNFNVYIKATIDFNSKSVWVNLQ